MNLILSRVKGANRVASVQMDDEYGAYVARCGYDALGRLVRQRVYNSGGKLTASNVKSKRRIAKTPTTETWP